MVDLHYLRWGPHHKLQTITEILDIVHSLRSKNPQHFGGRVFFLFRWNGERETAAFVGPLGRFCLGSYSSFTLPVTKALH